MHLNPELLEEARDTRAKLGAGNGLFLISADGERMMRVETGSHLLTVGEGGDAAAHSMKDIMSCAIVFDPPPVTTFYAEE